MDHFIIFCRVSLYGLPNIGNDRLSVRDKPLPYNHLSLSARPIWAGKGFPYPPMLKNGL